MLEPRWHYFALLDFCSSFGVLNDVFFKHGSKLDSKTPFESILGESWKDLGRIVGNILEDLDVFA